MSDDREIPVFLSRNDLGFIKGMESAASRLNHRDHVHMHPGGVIPPRLPIKVKLDPDECVIRREGSCVRADHPTEGSGCHA